MAAGRTRFIKPTLVTIERNTIKSEQKFNFGSMAPTNKVVIKGALVDIYMPDGGVILGVDKNAVEFHDDIQIVKQEPKKVNDDKKPTPKPANQPKTEGN